MSDGAVTLSGHRLLIEGGQKVTAVLTCSCQWIVTAWSSVKKPPSPGQDELNRLQWQEEDEGSDQ